MPIAREPSDSRRDAERHHQILLALSHATEEIAHLDEGHVDIDGVLGRLLPDLAAALNAQQAFVAVLREDEQTDGRSRWLELTAVYPQEERRGQRLAYSELFQRLIEHGKAIAIDPLGEERRDPIAGLEAFDATSAILVRMRAADRVGVVGMCNKADPTLGPYLAADRMTLDSIIQLVTIGIDIGEQRRRELEGIQGISAAISAELDLGELLPMIALGAARVFRAPATSLMLWDDSGENLVIKASWGLSQEYVLQQLVSRARAYTAISSDGQFLPFSVEDLRQAPFGDLEQIEREQLCSVLVAPLTEVSGEPIGALNIYSKYEARRFTRDEEELARLLADQIAVALRNAQQYEAIRRQSQHWQALHEASKAITAGFTVDDLKRVLDRIAEQAVQRITGSRGPKAVWAAILSYDETANTLCFESIYPPEHAKELKYRLGESRPLVEQAAQGRIGITGRTVLERKPQRVADVRAHPDYLQAHSATRSELDVPLLDGNRVIGVLSVESDQVGVFDEHDERALVGLAELAVIAVKNAEQAERLRRTNALAIMGAWGAEIAHDIKGEVGAIRRAVLVLQQGPDLPADVQRQLRNIDKYAEALAPPEIPESPPEPGCALVLRYAPLLDQVVRATVERLRPAHPHISWQYDLRCPDVRVAMHEQWLRRLVRHLVCNAVKAIPVDAQTRRVITRTVVKGAMAQVQVEDTGKGIQPDIEPLLFRQPILDRDGRAGRGLLLVDFLAQQHGGEAQLVWSRPGEGACFAFNIPLAQGVDPEAGQPPLDRT